MRFFSGSASGEGWEFWVCVEFSTYSFSSKLALILEEVEIGFWGEEEGVGW